MPSYFDLKAQLGVYAQYHNDFVNKLVHIVFVPCIMFTTLVFLQYTAPLAAWPAPVAAYIPAGVQLNVAAALALFYAVYYVILEPFAGGLFVPILGAMVYYSHVVHEDMLRAAILLFVFSWVMQIVSHSVFEKRAPALLDSLLQAFLLAPLFVWLEVLFMIGYRQQLAEAIDVQAKKDIAAFRKSQNKKKA